MTATAAYASTTKLFLPGSPPIAEIHLEDEVLESAAFLESACSCLGLSATTTTTILAQENIAYVDTETIYPCATTNGALPSPGPAYGKAENTGSLALSNDLYNLTSSEGSNAEACCNTCFFELENCVAAWWYIYEGCVVSQATNLTSATGSGISNSCPAGSFEGLSYVPDFDPPFASTGDIAGPCGTSYTNIDS